MKKPRKFSKLSRPQLPRAVPRPLKRLQRPARSAEERLDEALSTVPRITNDTVAEHREAVLSGARKYIYPLQHSKHKVVRISLVLLIAVVVGFFAFCGLSLYKFQTTSAFMYDVTRILPFPIAKTGGTWVSYEAYLFELRHNMHYYQTQQAADFSTREGQDQLKRLRQQAMDQVIQDAYVKQLAKQHTVSVDNAAVNDQIALLRNQKRLGNNQRVLRDVLNEYWGWNEADFKRKLKQELLQQAVVSKLDTRTNDRAEIALQQVRDGTDFGALAGKISDDPATKANGGQYPNPITLNDRDIPPALTAALFQLQANQTSNIVNTGYTLEIVKVLERSAGSLRASHIQFRYQPITTYTKPLQTKAPPHFYATF